MFTGSAKYYSTAQAVHGAVESALSNEINRSAIVPGAIAWDEAPCGLLAVSVGQVYLSDNFPAPAEAVIGGQCAAAWEVCQIVVQVIRCAPLPGDGEIAPTVESQEAVAAVMATDAAEVMKSINDWICQRRDIDIVDAIMFPIEPQGPEGDAVGIQTTVLVCLPRG